METDELIETLIETLQAVNLSLLKIAKMIDEHTFSMDACLNDIFAAIDSIGL